MSEPKYGISLKEMMLDDTGFILFRKKIMGREIGKVLLIGVIVGNFLLFLRIVLLEI